jgi:hypothetical protein
MRQNRGLILFAGRATALLAAALLVWFVQARPDAQAVPAAADEDSYVGNPQATLPRRGVDAIDARLDNVLYSLREARRRELSALSLEREGKSTEAMERWRDAMARYERLRREHLTLDTPFNTEPLVRLEWVEPGRHRDLMLTETWAPLADYLNSRMRLPEWPRPLRDQLAMRQQAPGEELLRRGLEHGDVAALRRCARLFQFSSAGRRALRVLAERALEAGDALMAVRWLYELQGSWPDDFARDPALSLLYLRACHEAGMLYETRRFLRRLERDGLPGRVDIGGRNDAATAHIPGILGRPAPSARPELRPAGWRTLQGAWDRNAVAPPVTGLGAMVSLKPGEKPGGIELADGVPGLEDGQERQGRTRPPVPMVFPVSSSAGFFLHRISATDPMADELLWFPHGRETGPVTLAVPRDRRYQARSTQDNRVWWGSSSGVERPRYRVLGMSIGRVTWNRDGRESDVLFAVMGRGSPTRNRGSEPTGNQIQAFDLDHDAALRVTIPNRRVESTEEFAFLQHVVFCGAPVVRDNRLYIAGAVAESNSSDLWLFCFDVTPKGDAAEGEGKLLWRCHIGGRAVQQMNWWAQENPELPELSSVAEQGGLLLVSTHAGATVAVDRETGELCWFSRYRRPRGNLQRGWFSNAPTISGGTVQVAPYDFDAALELDAITGQEWAVFPVDRIGPTQEYEYLLGVVDNRLYVQGRSRVYCWTLTTPREDGPGASDFGETRFQTEPFGDVPTGRGVIAGERILVPFADRIVMYEAGSGKLAGSARLEGVEADLAPVTLTVFCRGPSWRDEHGQLRFHPAVLTDPQTGNVYNVEHLRNGDTFTFPSGAQAAVRKQTFVLLASARRAYLFHAQDGGTPEAQEDHERTE